MKERFTESS